MIATIPLGAVQEITLLTNAFSSEFGWTAGPALNIVTKGGTNGVHGELLFMARPGDLQAKSFSTEGFCPPSVLHLRYPFHPHLDQPRGCSRFAAAVLRHRQRSHQEGQDLLLPHLRLHAAGSHHLSIQQSAGFRAARRRPPRLHRPLPPVPGQCAHRSPPHSQSDADVPLQQRPLPRRQPAGRRGRHQRPERGAPLLTPLVDHAAQSHRRGQRQYRQ